MKLALVHDWLTGMRGGEKCLEVLCREFPDARLFSLIHRPGSTSPAIERMAITTSFLESLPGIWRHYRYFLPLMPRAVERLPIPSDVDMVVSFSHAVAKGVIVPPGVPHLCYCFTPMRYAWHLRDQYLPPTASRWPAPRRFARAVQHRLLDRLRQWDRQSSRRVTHFVAISRTVADRIRQCYGRQSTIVYPPVDTDFYTPAYQAAPPGPAHRAAGGATHWPRREDFYLVVSALVPYKRIDLAIAACRQSRRRLTIIGSGPEAARLARLARGDQRIAFLGWRSNDEIRDHLRRCRALLFPGCEDFGIVPLEAQACGTPVVALGRGGATETVLPAGDRQVGTGVLFHRPTPEALCAAIDWLESHPWQFDPALARRWAQRFSVERFRSELLVQLDEAACQPAPVG